MNVTKRGGSPWADILTLDPLPTAEEAAQLRGCSVSAANAYAASHGFRWRRVKHGRPVTARGPKAQERRARAILRDLLP